jgi:uncharacterized membrane protein YfcA
MPLRVKVVFSIFVLAVAYASSIFLQSLGQDLTPSLALFLGVFAMVSFWIFPEVTHKKGK